MKVIVAAARVEERAESREIADGALVLEPIGTFRFTETRGAVVEPEAVELPKDALVEIVLENGVSLWRRAEDAVVKTETDTRGGSAETALVLPATFELGAAAATRGVGGIALRLVRFFSIRKLTRKAVQTAAERIEAELAAGGPGLYRAGDPHALTEQVGEEDIPTDRPVLLLLHGTASSTAGSFGGLVRSGGPEDGAFRGHWRVLRDRYRDRDGAGTHHIYALEHRTLTESPVANAIQLLRALPVGARLHLVSHSRGGLIGELLARAGSTRVDGEGKDLPGQAAPVDDLDRKIFQAARKSGGTAAGSAARELEELAELNRLLIAKRPVVERFVRVACPARGTILASERLDIYLSVVLTLVDLVPGTLARVFYQPFKAFVQAMVASRTKAETLPGLEAMMPGSPLVAMLNRPDVRIAGTLAILAGDVEPAGLFRGVAVLATDLFFREDHDVVVDSKAMTGGAIRTGGAGYFFDQGGEVNHFNYFRNERTAGRLLAGLGEEDPRDAGFRPLETPVAPMLVRGATSEEAARDLPVCFILPGIMGSHLRVKNDRIWFEILEVIFGGVGRIEIGDPHVMPDGVMADYYGALTSFLRPSHVVRPFAYDWRLSMRVEAARLARAVGAALDESGQPIRIIGHSMGGLVARLMMIDFPEIWRRVADRDGSRLVMLGTPNGGSVSMAAGLMGRDRTIRQLEAVDKLHDMEELTGIVGRMPGVVELLPHDRDGLYYEEATWSGWRKLDREPWQPPRAQLLQDAARVRDALASGGIDRDRMVYLAGRADLTPAAIDVVTDGQGKRIRVLATAFGDGRVPWRTGLLKDVPTWYAETEHGDLARDRNNFDAILDLLNQGRTGRLPSTPRQPPVTRGSFGQFEMPREPVLYPGPGSFTTIPMGGTEPDRRSRSLPCRVAIRHGDLAYTRHPVMVGHYRDDQLIGAEKALDTRLGGRLDLRRRLGLYPGALGTAEVVFGRPKEDGIAGGIVVGLGDFGRLTVAQLTATAMHAVLAFALRSLERRAGTAQAETALSCLLIGHRDSAISVKDSLGALLDAVVAANLQLDEADRIREIEIVEIFEDTAIEAAEVLGDFVAENRYGDALEIDHHLGQLRGGRRRQVFRREEEWQHRLTVEVADDRHLSFTSLNGRALARRDDQPIERERVDRYLAEAIRDARADPEIGKLLFEWLIPPRLKGFSADARRISIELDEAAAAYPWELLHDEFGGKKPIALQASMIRQLRQAGTDIAIPAKPGGALLIGDPPSDLPELPGAQREIAAVAEQLDRRGWTEVTALVRRPEAEILPQLSLTEYQILHIAAHGVHEPDTEDGPGNRGMVIGRDQYITPAFVRTLRRMPEFVFLNCCHLGRVERAGPAIDAARLAASRADRPKLAANLAVAFIRGGAKAVVAAGWEVSDSGAEAFATRLYERLLAGESFGEATLAARIAAASAAPGSNTWGAYQCYGDPQYRLGRNPLAARGRGGPARYAAMEQVVIELGNIARQASVTASPEEARSLRGELETIDEALRHHTGWLTDARLLAALAEAWSELDCFAEAIRYYDEAVRVEPAEVPVSAVERMLEFRVRSLFRARRAGEVPPTLREMRGGIEHARERLTGLNAIAGVGGTAGRHRMIGALWLRDAAIAPNAEEAARALEAATESYEQALRLSAGAAEESHERAALDSALVAAIRAWRTGGAAEGLGGFEVLGLGPMDEERPVRGFADAARETDRDLARHVVAGTLAGHTEAVLQGYAAAWRRGGSVREIGMVIDWLRIIADLVADDDGRLPRPVAATEHARRAVAEPLRQIARDLEQMASAG